MNDDMLLGVLILKFTGAIFFARYALEGMHRRELAAKGAFLWAVVALMEAHLVSAYILGFWSTFMIVASVEPYRFDELWGSFGDKARYMTATSAVILVWGIIAAASAPVSPDGIAVFTATAVPIIFLLYLVEVSRWDRFGWRVILSIFASSLMFLAIGYVTGSLGFEFLSCLLLLRSLWESVECFEKAAIARVQAATQPPPNTWA